MLGDEILNMAFSANLCLKQVFCPRRLLVNNQLKRLQPGLFTDLNALVVLALGQNQLSQVAADACAGLDSLVALDLNNNQLSSVPAGLLHNTSQLTDLYLGRNQLTAVPLDLIAANNSLIILSLLENQISSLPADLFLHYPQLQQLLLHNNNIRVVPPQLWQPLTAQDRDILLTMENNPSRCSRYLLDTASSPAPHATRFTKQILSLHRALPEPRPPVLCSQHQ
eukprot:m.217254 g.217254  ORF g.217254 m.217254 type:complete len:224 (+) comp22234_c0_seq21:125-796(+)